MSVKTESSDFHRTVTHIKTIHLCQNLRNIHIGGFKKIYIPIKCFKTQQTKGNIYDIL